MLQSHYGVRKSAAEIADLATLLPGRRPVSVEGGDLVESAIAPERADHRAEGSRHAATLREAQTAVTQALQGLSAEDRLVLKMYFESGLTIAAIAAALGVRQRQLYTRRDRSLRQLSGSFTDRGLDPGEIFEALEWLDRRTRAV